MITNFGTEAYLFRHWKKSVPFGRKWRISAPGIVINIPKIIDLFSYKFYVGPHKGGFGFVNYNPRCIIIHLCQICTLLALQKVHLGRRTDLFLDDFTNRSATF